MVFLYCEVCCDYCKVCFVSTSYMSVVLSLLVCAVYDFQFEVTRLYCVLLFMCGYSVCLFFCVIGVRIMVCFFDW